MNQKLLTLILVLGILSLIPAAFAADTLIRNTTGDLEISTKTTDGGGVHIRSRQIGTGLFINTSNYVGIGDASPVSLFTVGAADAFQVNSSGVVAAGTWNGTALTNAYVSDTITVGASGSVNDAALSANVSTLGAAVEKGEIANSGTLSFDWADSEVVNSLTNTGTFDGQEGTYYDQRVYNSSSNYLGGGYISGGNEKPNWAGFGAGKLKLQMLAGSNVGGGGSWNDVLWLSSYTGGDVKDSYALIFNKYADEIGFTRQPYDSVAWGTYQKLWHTGNDGAASGLDADLLDGLSSASFSQLGTAIEKGEIANSGTLSFDWANSEVSDTITVGASGSVNDAALSASVSLLGTAIEKGEIANSGTLSFDWADSEVANTITASNYLPLAGGTLTGVLDVNSTIQGNLYQSDVADSYDKIRVYPSASYTIGMKSAQTYGGLNDWAMTFTMNNDIDRGWLWRDEADIVSDGAMSLTTAGVLTVKSTITASGGNSGNWNTAYGWGNHASAGYLTSETGDIAGVTAGTGLTGGGTTGTVTLNVGAGTGISVAADSISATLGTAIEKGEIANSGTLSFDWANSEVSDTITVGATGLVNDAALSASVSLLGTAIEKGEIANSGTLSFDWADSEVSNTLTASAVPWSGITSKPTLPSSQEGSRYTTDFNTILSTGFFNAQLTPVNSPGGSYGNLIVARGIDTGLQIYGGYNNDQLWFRGWWTSGASFGTWRKVWHDGNDGAASGLDADLLDGANLSASAGNSTVVQRHSSGYIYANYFNTTPNDVTTAVTRVLVETGNDGFMRHGTQAAIRIFIGAGSGNGLDADLLDGLSSASFSQGAHTTNTTCNGISCAVTNTGTLDGFNATSGSTVSTIAARNASGDINARLFRSEYDSTNATINYIMTQIDTVSNNYIRPSTPAQLISALNLSTGAHTTNTTCNGISCAVTNTGTLDGFNGSDFLRSNADDSLTAAIVVPTANRDEGIFGTYDSTKTQHVWSMGTAYRNNAAGTSFGNLYGLAYKYNGSAGGHGIYLVQNGTAYAGLGTNIWTSGTITANKANVNTVDPIYTIDGIHYATYMAGMTGLKEETTGVIKLNNESRIKNYEYTIDFNNLEQGSDVWLFSQTINIDGRAYIAEDGMVYTTTAEELFDNFTVLLTPNFAGDVWYEKDVENKTITIFANPNSSFVIHDSPLEVSYRLTAPRFDWKGWSNYSSDDYEGLNLDKLLK